MSSLSIKQLSTCIHNCEMHARTAVVSVCVCVCVHVRVFVFMQACVVVCVCGEFHWKLIKRSYILNTIDKYK